MESSKTLKNISTQTIVELALAFGLKPFVRHLVGLGYDPQELAAELENRLANG